MSGIRKMSLLRHLGAFAVLLSSSFFPPHIFSRAVEQDDIDALHNYRKTDVRFRFECNQVAHARVDPVVNPGGCAGHMHTFFGNANILKHAVSVNDAGLKKENTIAQTTSCTAIQGSLCWAPSLYYKDPNDGNKYKIAFANVVVYYEFPRSTGEKLTPIPVGFRQLVGNAGRATPFSLDKLTKETYWPYFTCYGANDEEITGLSIEDFAREGERCSKIEGTIIFRDCLKTANITDSENHKDHAAYADVNQSCPASHPFRIPRVRMEVSYQLDLSYDLAYVTLSTGLQSSSMHGDYIAGWDDQQKLIDAIATCDLDEELEHTANCSLKSEVALEQPEYGTIAVDTTLLPSEEVTNISQLQLIQNVGCPAGYGDSTQLSRTTSTEVASSSSPAGIITSTSTFPAGHGDSTQMNRATSIAADVSSSSLAGITTSKSTFPAGHGDSTELNGSKSSSSASIVASLSVVLGMIGILSEP